MSKTIYVGNLPREATSDGLRAIFETDGREVESIKLPTSGKSGKIRGFAFIIMATEEQAEAAKVALQGTTIGDNEIKFGDARDKKVETGGGSYEDDMGGPHGGGGGNRRGR